MITFNNIGYAGRLGNQMFQIAALYGLAYKNNYAVSIPVKKNQQIKPDGCLDVFTNKWISYKLDLLNCFNISIHDNNGICSKNQYKESFHHFDEKFFDIKDDTNIDGYFQSELYFSHIRQKIQSIFTFREEIYKSAKSIYTDSTTAEDRKTVSIHVRRGDYLGIQNQFPIMSADYYQRALNTLPPDDYKYFIFSDDIAWCKSVFGDDDENIKYLDKTTHYIDMCLMSMCDHNIIGNSTFGWWGAWLNKNKNKIVISPKQWFGQDLNHLNVKDLIPIEWIKI